MGMTYDEALAYWYGRVNFERQPYWQERRCINVQPQKVANGVLVFGPIEAVEGFCSSGVWSFCGGAVEG